MNILELENAFPTPEFHFNEAAQWLGKTVYIKNMQRHGEVIKMQRNKVGYGLIIDCHGFLLHLTKPWFAKWVALKPGQVELPVMH